MKNISKQRQEIEDDLNEHYEIFSSLLESQNQWSALPEIVVLTFKSVGHLLGTFRERVYELRDAVETTIQSGELLRKEQQKNIEEVHKIIDLLADKQQELQSRAKAAGLKRDAKHERIREEGLDSMMVEEVRQIVSGLIQENMPRASPKPIDDLRKEVQESLSSLRLSFSKEFQALQNEIMAVRSPPVNNNNYQSQKRKWAEEMKIVRNQLTLLSKSIREKPDKEIMESMLNHIVKSNQFRQQMAASAVRGSSLHTHESAPEEVASMKALVEDLLIKKADKKDFNELRNRVTKELTEKIKLSEVEDLLKRMQEETLRRVEDLRGEIKKVDKLAKSVKLASLSSAQCEPLPMPIMKKESLGVIKKEKSNHTISDIKSSLQRMEKKIEDKLVQGYKSGGSTLEYRSMKVQIKDELEKNIMRKIDEKLDAREKKLCESIEETQENIKQEMLAKMQNPDQQKILLSLAKNNIMARWTYSSGQKTTTGMIPWEDQLVNTMPDLFEYRKNTTGVVVNSAGSYRVQFVYFSIQPTSVQMFVNSDRVMIISEDSTKQINRKHPSGVIGGVSLIEVIVLPPRGKLSFQVPKESNGEAYLALYKL